ncbi:hypothetical protein BU24DRAFT_464270 [Aaosphaeria arxii CBS 175.79]|uniref:Killer toxin Kp4 domain-containing protein n=1 Tax=Aaosphaeria arxii CBS 175.79 TaxID=1450172 RepID=A0A6A5XMD7_9PLEO|nr:uncharacterized protein BU24DRAFT_464270 [Aaosphaeria arxii CBS 175.79]KAF2013494.1 hypothetical protein BU24DRAFT_464270 [Aaosphaeria arxii CBS 175.79]
MKTFIIAPILAMLATSVIADNCKQGLKYCGSSLLKKGDYREQIDQALAVAGHASWDGTNVLFDCLGGPSGAIKFIKGCEGGCKDNGKNKNDACK